MLDVEVVVFAVLIVEVVALEVVVVVAGVVVVVLVLVLVLAAFTAMFRSIVPVRPFTSVAVIRTYLVPAS